MFHLMICIYQLYIYTSGKNRVTLFILNKILTYCCHVFYFFRMGKHFSGHCIVTVLIAVVTFVTSKPRSRNKERTYNQLHLLAGQNINRDILQRNGHADIVDMSSADIRRLKRYLPRERDFRQRKLMKMLGKKYLDKNWMSTDKLTNDVIGTDSVFTTTANNIMNMVNTNESTKHLENDILTALNSLLQRMSCEVKFHWKDLGPLVWPRYVKHGSCDSKQSCSFPAGMKCVPGGFMELYILKWQCTNVKKITINKERVCVTEKRSSKSKRRKLNCKWKRTQLRVLQNCVCKC